MIIYSDLEQGTEEWLAVRRGRITGSRFKDARSTLASGKPSKASELYARETARERCGGRVPALYQTPAMRFGSEQEVEACSAYETMTGYQVQHVGFCASECGLFGVSPDGLIGDDGVLEIKTIVGTDNLFETVVAGDISRYIDQCLGYLLFLDRQWVDLVLWAPDLEDIGLGISIIRIGRDEAKIDALRTDLSAFAQRVLDLQFALQKCARLNVQSLRAGTI